jgi:hypothetical protein
LRQESLRTIEGQQQLVAIAGLPARPTFFELSAWAGTWQITFENGKTGQLQLRQNGQTFVAEVRLDIFQGERLAEQYFGIANSTDSYTARVDWTGAMRYLPVSQTAGYMTLRLNDSGSMTATMHLAGEAPAKANVRRSRIAEPQQLALLK